MIELCCIALGVHIATLHFEQRDYNDFNPGLYVRVQRWQVGAYYNSLRKPSAYISYAFPLTQRIALHVGAVTGYPAAPVSPAVMLSYSFDNGARAFVFPSTPKNSGGIHAAYEFHKGETR